MRSPGSQTKSLVTKAFNFAQEAHKGQIRNSGEPYFNHVFETAKILAELGLGKRTVSAGLLHDVLEDAGVTDEEFEQEFGKEVFFLVQGVTKLGKIRYTGEQRHVESLRKFFVAMSKDIRVLIIKLADRLHNMRTLEHVHPEKRYRIAMETMEIYVPLAYRLGIRKIKRELEDLAFKYALTDKYEEIKQLLKERRSDKERYLEKFQKNLLKAFAGEKVKDFNTDTRMKSLYSIYRKMISKERDIDKIYDISALRINVSSISDCYKVLGIIHGIWRPLPGRIKDYIAFPKPNGYQSLHTTVFTGDGGIIEIQIRTHEMHERAEYGMASHIAYKENDSSIEDPYYSWFKQFFPQPEKEPIADEVTSEKIKRIPGWVKELVDAQSYVTLPTEFIDNLKSDFFEHRMFIFDINGEVIDLPVDSTPLDFAYEKDIDEGNHFHGAKVNGKFVALNTKLRNGDIVEIITKKTPQVTEKWLEYCKTIKAKQQIRKALEEATPQNS